MSEATVVAAEGAAGREPGGEGGVAAAGLPAVPMCPRCGYDQSGAVKMWESSCPLRGVCSECGLELDWGQILNAMLRGPAWSYEHGHRRTAARWAETSVRALWPWRFHRSILMAHEIRGGRLVRFAAVWVLLGLLSVHLLAVVETLRYVPRHLGWWDQVRFVFNPYYSVSHLLDWLMVAAMSFLPIVFMGMLLSILDTTFSRARVRRVHLLRGVCYAAPTAVLMPAVLIPATLVLESALRDFGAGDLMFLMLALPIMWIVWLGVWWHQFVGHYVQLPRPAIIVTVLMVTSVLATLATFALPTLLFSPDGLFG